MLRYKCDITDQWFNVIRLYKKDIIDQAPAPAYSLYKHILHFLYKATFIVTYIKSDIALIRIPGTFCCLNIH